MSLSELPPELLAHIASYLDFRTISEFSQTNCQTHQILKRYKAEKTNIFQLRFEFGNENGVSPKEVEVCGQFAKSKLFALKNVANEKYHQGISFILNKFRSIEWLDISGTVLNTSMYDVLMNCSAKIELLTVARSAFHMPSEHVVQLFTKYKKVHLYGCRLTTELLTDGVFCQILSTTELSLISCLIPYQPYVTTLTDLTLKAIGEHKIQEELCLNNWKSYFTVKGIHELIEKVLSQDNFDVCWDLGVLYKDQFLPACEMAFNINRNVDCSYYIMQYHGSEREFLIQLKQEDANRHRLHVAFQIEEA